MRTTSVFKMFTLALLLSLAASSAQACGDKAKATSTSFQIAVTGISAKTAPLIVTALQTQLRQSSSLKPSCCQKKAESPKGTVRFSPDLSTLIVGVVRPASIRLSAIRSILEENSAKIASRTSLTGAFQLAVSGVSCGGCASSLQERIDGLASTTATLVRTPEQGKASVHVTLAEGKTLTFEELRKSLGAKFEVTDIVFDARCPRCTGFVEKENKTGCGGCDQG